MRLLFCFKASASAWRAEQADHMNASDGLKSTAALAPSSPIELLLRSIVVRLLFFFKASASAWPGWAGRPHECKQGSQEHGRLHTIGTDANPSELDRSKAAVLLQRLCQCLAGLGRQATWMQAGGRSRERERVGKNPLSRPSSVLQAGSPWDVHLMILLALLPNSLRRV